MNKYIYHILFLLFFIFTSCGLDEKDIKNPLEERQIQEQIKSAIRGLKNEIGHLKNVMEHPDYGKEIIMHPTVNRNSNFYSRLLMHSSFP